MDAGTLSVALVDRAEVAIHVTGRSRRRIRQLIASSGTRVANFAAVAGWVGHRTNHTIDEDAVAHAVAGVVGAEITVAFAEGALRGIGQCIACTGCRIANRTGIAWTGRSGADYLIKHHTVTTAIAVLDRAEVAVILAWSIERRIGQVDAGAGQWITILAGIAGSGRTGAGGGPDINATASTIALVGSAQAAVIFARRTERRIRQWIACSCGGRALGAGVAELRRAGANYIASGGTAAHAIALVQRTQVSVEFAIGAGGSIRQVVASSRTRIAHLAGLTGRHRTITCDIGQIDATARSIAMVDGAQVAIKLARRAERRVRQFFAEAGIGIT